eukprot:PhM_4_TR4855/c0_g1_i1/m.2370/K22139/MPC2; mitochondrial pyruvate carrier 2
MCNPAASVTAPFWFPKFMHKYILNPHFIERLKPLEEKNPIIKWLNIVYNTAPASKWTLSLVPMYGVFVGVPAPENIDLNTSVALTATGVVWAYYSTVITPASTSLFIVNCAMGSVNGYNAYRAFSYQQQQQQKNKTLQTEEKKIGK